MGRILCVLGSMTFLASMVSADPCNNVFTHTTDGSVATCEWNSPTTSVATFSVVGNTGGANLYVDDVSPLVKNQPHNLYLMYDYWNSPATLGTNATNSFFDVFFQVGDAPARTDYLVRVFQNSFLGYENTTGHPAPEPNGAFDPNSSPWVALDAGDLALAGFVGAIGFGTNPLDPAHTADHLIAEFQLTVNTCVPSPISNTQLQGNASAAANPCAREGGQNGIYSPDPAFWSASAGPDPPISSGIFTLNPDGTTTVGPILGNNGGPVLQDSDVVPEPATMLMLGSGLVGLARLLRKKR